MAAYATVLDLAARWRPLAPSEETIAATLLEDASAMVDARVSIDQTDASQKYLAKIVVCNMTRRAMEAHTDAFGFEDSGATVWTPANPAGGLRLYDNEAALIKGYGTNSLYSLRASRC